MIEHDKISRVEGLFDKDSAIDATFPRDLPRAFSLQVAIAQLTSFESII
jgi:hypothetical protein